MPQRLILVDSEFIFYFTEDTFPPVVRMEPKASHMLGKCFTTDPQNTFITVCTWENMA